MCGKSVHRESRNGESRKLRALEKAYMIIIEWSSGSDRYKRITRIYL